MEEEKSALKYFTPERLEKFCIAYKRVPSLWHPRYSNRKKCVRAQWLTNLAKLLGEWRGKGVARRMAELCRCFTSLLRHEATLAVAKAQMRAGPAGTLAERARALMPAWAAHADGYLHVVTDVLAAHGKTNEIPAKIASSSPVVQGRAKRARNAAVEARRAAAVERGGRGRAADVLRAVRRAALAAGGLARAADAAAAALREPADEVLDIWTHLRLTALRKLRALLRRGDEVGALPVSERLSALEWAAADLAVYFGHSVLHEDHFRQYHSLRALLATFHLVQRRGLEPEAGAAPPAPAAWRRAAARYCRGRVAASGVLLQRRWHELKAAARRALRAAWRGEGAAPPPLLQAVARRYPHVVTAELPPWARLVAGGHVAAPTIERGPTPGSGSEHSSSASDMSDGEDDLILVEKNIETIDLDGEDTDQQKDIPAAPRPIDMPSIDDKEDSSTSNAINAQADNEACEGNYKAMDAEKETTDVESNSEKDMIATLREMDVNAVEMTIQFDDDDDSEINTEDSRKAKQDKEMQDPHGPNKTSSDTIEIESLNKKPILADKGMADLSQNNEVVNKCNPTVDTMENVDVVRVQDIGAPVESYIDKSVVSDITNQVSETNNSCIRSGLRSRTDSSDSDSMYLVIDIEDNACKQTASLVEKRDSNLNADLDETSPAIGDKTKLNRTQSYLTESILTPKNNDNVYADRPENRVTSVLNKHNIAENDLEGFILPPQNVDLKNSDDDSLNTKSQSITEILQMSDNAHSRNTNKINLKPKSDSHTIIDQTLSNDDFSNEKTPDVKMKIDLLKLVQSSKIDDSEIDNFKLNSDDEDELDPKLRTVQIIEKGNRSATDNIVGGHAIRNPILLQMLRSQSDDLKRIKRFESSNIRIRPVTGKTNKKALNKNVGDVFENNSNISDDLIDEDSSSEEDGDYGEIDPKLLMYPVVKLTRLDLDRLPPLRQNRYITLFDPTLPPKFVFKNVALLRLCRPCVVLLERIDLERVGGGGSRVTKKVELSDIEEVRRINKKILTAQVAPISIDVDKRAARRARSAKTAKDDISPEDLQELLKNLAESEACPGRACVGCLGCAARRLCAPADGTRGAAAQRRLLRLAARHKTQSGKPLDVVYMNRPQEKEPPARVRSPYDPERAQREWIREKNLASEKFGIKPRSYKKKPVTETPSEPATITQPLSDTSATQSLERTRPGSRLIDPERAQREWIREKNLASEKFGIKPRSYKKKPVTETPSEPATITQPLSDTSATQSLERTRPGSRLIDPERAQREWIREKNLASEKFGIKPRSYKKKPVTETPSEPATITQLLGDTSATQSLERTPPGSRPIDSDRSLFSVSPAPEETIDLTITPSQYPPNVQVILNHNSTSTYLPLTEESLLRQAKNQPIFKLENNLFNPNTVADINKRLGDLADDAPPAAAGEFCPVITSVTSLAPDAAGHCDCLNGQIDNIISSKVVNQLNREATPGTSQDASKTGSANNLIVSLKPSLKKIREREQPNDKYAVKKLKRLVNQKTCGQKVLNQSEPPSSLLRNVLKSDQAQNSPIAHTEPTQKESSLSTDPQATVAEDDEVTRAKRQLATLQARGRKWLPLNPTDSLTASKQNTTQNPASHEQPSNTSARQPLLVNSVKAGASQSNSMQHNPMNSQSSLSLSGEQVEQKNRQVTYLNTNLLTGGALEVNAQSDPQSSSLMINVPNEVNLAVSQLNYPVNQHAAAAASHQNISIPSSQAFGNNSITQQLWVDHHTKTLQMNSVQANSPQSNLLPGSTSYVQSNPHLSMVSGQQPMPLNSVQAGPGNSLLVGSAQNSPLLVNMPQVTSFQPGLSYVTSLQGSFSQVTNFQAGSSQATPSGLLQINSFPTGHSQVTLSQPDPSQATSFLPSITYQADSSQATSFEAGHSLGSVSQTDSRTQTGSLQTDPPRAISINVVPQTSVQVPLCKGKPSYGSDFYNGRMVDTAALPAVPAAQYVRGRDRTTLAVLAGAWPARRHLLLRAAAGDVRGPVFGFTPPCRLLVQDEDEDGPTPPKLPKNAPESDSTARSTEEDAAAKKPPRLRVKSFAKMGGDERPAPALRSDGARLSAPARVFLADAVYQRLCDEPLTYAKVLTVVASVRECYELVARRAQLTVFSVNDGRMHAVHAELTADGVLLSGSKEISEYLHELAVVLTPRPSPSPSKASRAKDNLESVKGRQIVKRPLGEPQNSLLMERTVIDLDSDDD